MVRRTFQVRGTALRNLAVAEDNRGGWIADTRYILTSTATVIIRDGAILLSWLRYVSESSAEMTMTELLRHAGHLQHKQDSWQGWRDPFR